MQGSLLSNADEDDTGVIEDFDDGADLVTMKALGFVIDANIRVLQSRGGAVKVIINEKTIQSLNREQAEKIILEA